LLNTVHARIIPFIRLPVELLYCYTLTWALNIQVGSVKLAILDHYAATSEQRTQYTHIER